MLNRFLEIAMLVGGRLSGALVGFVFLPLYKKYLGDHEFGMVAIVFALQTMLIILDFGVSVRGNREFSNLSSANIVAVQKNIFDSEILILFFYIFVLLITFLCFHDVFLWPVICVTFFYFQVMQNFYFSLLLARQKYIYSNAIQIAFNILRGFLSLLVVKYTDTGLNGFFTVQSCISFFQVIFYRIYIRKIIFKDVFCKYKFVLRNLLFIFHENRFLIFSSLASAMVLQVDKPLLGYFLPASEVGIYYMAAVFSMLPITFLAIPIFQYYQPKVFFENENESTKVINRFGIVLNFILFLFGYLMWVFRDFLLIQWLGREIVIISDFVEVLLPASIVGAMGFIPYLILLKFKKYKIQSIINWVGAVFLLISLIYSGVNANLLWVCYAYMIYHFIMVILQWISAIMYCDNKIYAVKPMVFQMLMLVIALIISIKLI